MRWCGAAAVLPSASPVAVFNAANRLKECPHNCGIPGCQGGENGGALTSRSAFTAKTASISFGRSLASALRSGALGPIMDAWLEEHAASQANRPRTLCSAMPSLNLARFSGRQRRGRRVFHGRARAALSTHANASGGGKLGPLSGCLLCRGAALEFARRHIPERGMPASRMVKGFDVREDIRARLGARGVAPGVHALHL